MTSPQRPAATWPIGRATLAGSTLTRGQRPETVRIPGYDAAFYWQVLTGSPAIGQATIGGRMPVLLPSAGLLVAPDADSATVTISVWWAYAGAVDLVRVDPDGSRTPIRASPVLMDPARSRRNAAINPSARDALTGYSAGSNTTLSRLSALTTPLPGVTTSTRVTATAAGAVALNLDADVITPAGPPHSFLVRTSALSTALGITVRWYDAGGQDLGTTTHAVTAATRQAAVGAWTWVTIPIDAWPAGAANGVGQITASGLPAGGSLDVTARMIGDGDYLDGDMLGGAWIGTPGISASDLAPLYVVVDKEAPLDRPVVYELTSGAAPGYIARSDTVTLPAGRLHFSRRQCLLTHPGLDRTIRAWVEHEPSIKRNLEQASFKVKGRARKVVISESTRDGDEGELTFVAETFEERDRLLTFLDGTPLLLRFPPSYGHPPLWWLSFGTVQIEPQFRNARRPLRRLKVPFTEVDRPTVARMPAA